MFFFVIYTETNTSTGIKLERHVHPSRTSIMTGGEEVVRNSPVLAGTLTSPVWYVQNKKRKRQQIRVN